MASGLTNLNRTDVSEDGDHPQSTTVSLTSSFITLPRLDSLTHKKNLLKQITSRVTNQLNLNFQSMSHAHHHRSHIIKSNERLTKSKPMKLRRRINPSEYSFEDEVAKDSRTLFFQPKYTAIRWSE